MQGNINYHQVAQQHPELPVCSDQQPSQQQYPFKFSSAPDKIESRNPHPLSANPMDSLLNANNFEPKSSFSQKSDTFYKQKVTFAAEPMPSSSGYQYETDDSQNSINQFNNQLPQMQHNQQQTPQFVPTNQNQNQQQAMYGGPPTGIIGEQRCYAQPQDQQQNFQQHQQHQQQQPQQQQQFNNFKQQNFRPSANTNAVPSYVMQKRHQQMQPQYSMDKSSNHSGSNHSRYSNPNYSMQQLSLGSGARSSPYSKYYPNLVVSLYFGKGDGEIFLIHDEETGLNKMVTCIDISTLYQEKRGSAIQMIQTLSSFKHENLVPIEKYWIVPNYLLFVEMEAPDPVSQWKSFCKQSFTSDQTLTILNQIVIALEYLHSQNYIHRDVHPSRIQQFTGGVVKFNTVGLPYNFKKLLRRSDFSGHVNYSAPELILEKSSFSEKIDIWALGCCIYFIFNKCDPFEGKDPQVIKQKILNFNINQTGQEEGLDTKKTAIRQLIQACLNFQDMIRPSCAQLLQAIAKARSTEVQPTNPSPSYDFNSELSPELKDNKSDRETNSITMGSVPNESGNMSNSNLFTPQVPQFQRINKVFSSNVPFFSSKETGDSNDHANKSHNVNLQSSQAPNQNINNNQLQAASQGIVKHPWQLDKSLGQIMDTTTVNSDSKQTNIKLNSLYAEDDKDTQDNSKSIFSFSNFGKTFPNNDRGQPTQELYKISTVAELVCEEDKKQIKNAEAIQKTKLGDPQEQAETEALLAELGEQRDPIFLTNKTEMNIPNGTMANSATQQLDANKTQPAMEVEAEDKIEQSVKRPTGFGEKDILFDGGSDKFVVNEIPPLRTQEIVSQNILTKPIEAAAKIKESQGESSVRQQLDLYSAMPAATSFSQIQNQTALMQQDFTLTFEAAKKKAMSSPFYKKIFEDGGRYYEGEIRDELKNGIGVLLRENGETYEGLWQNGVKKGFGKYTFSNGDVYVGNFDGNKPNGHGKKEFALSGSIYEGQWKDGKATGQGILSAGFKVLKGEFWDCHLHGFGQLTSSDIKYIGEFRNGEFDGFGKLENLELLQRYVGMFQQDKMHGQGVLMDQKNAILFSGTWKEGKRNGSGKQTNFAVNQTITATWQNDNISFVESFMPISEQEMILKNNLEQDSTLKDKDNVNINDQDCTDQ